MKLKTVLRRGIGMLLASVLVIGSGQTVQVHHVQAAPTSFPAAFAWQPQSLIVNGDFEGTDNFVTDETVEGQWFLWQDSQKVMGGYKHGGESSVKLTGEGSAVDQRVTLKPNTEYVLSTWVRADSGQGVRLRVFLNGSNQDRQTFDTTTSCYNTWAQYKIQFTTKSDTTFADVGVVRAHDSLAVDGNVWVDDIIISETSSPFTVQRTDSETITAVLPNKTSLAPSEVSLRYGVGAGSSASQVLDCNVSFDPNTKTATITHANVSTDTETLAAFELTISGETFTQAVTLPVNEGYVAPMLSEVTELKNGSATLELAAVPTKDLTAQQITITYADYDGAQATASVSKVEKIGGTTYKAEFNRIPAREEDHTYTLTFDVGGVPVQKQLIVNTTRGKTFYLDATNGDDSNDGTSPDRAWKTLDRVNETVFMEGSSLLLKSGETWIGTLAPQGSGVEGAPIILSSYGEGARPRILMDESNTYDEKVMRVAAVTTRKVNETFRLQNQSHWEISNIEFQNPNYEENRPFDPNRPLERGMYIFAQDIGQLDHIYINNVWIHGFQTTGGENKHKESGGIIFFISASETGSERKPTWFNDIRITNCTVEKVGRSGFFLLSPWKTRDMTSNGKWGGRWTMVNNAGEGSLGAFTPSTNFYFGQNIFRDIAGDGIILQCMKGAVAEYNLVDNTCTGNSFAAGIFPYLVSDATVQYNELARTNRGGDAQGVEIDALNENVAVVYNYSHANAGGFIQFCALENLPSYDSYYAYNISENDGSTDPPQGNNALIMPLPGTINCSVFNNTVYFNPKGSIHYTGNEQFYVPHSGARTSIAIYNNIFYRADNAYTFNTEEKNFFNSMTALADDNVVPQGQKGKFANNLFYNFNTSGLNTNSAFYKNNIWGQDPQLSAPGTIGDGDTDALLKEKNIEKAWNLDAYKLRALSPAIDAGRPIRDIYASIPDMLGNSVDTSTPDLGAIQYRESTSITINKTLDKTYDKAAVTLTKDDVTVKGSPGDVSFTWYSIGESGVEEKLPSAPTDAGTYKVVAEVAASGYYEAASAEQEFTISKADPDYETPTGLTAVVGQKLQDVELPDGFTWTDPEQNVGAAGSNKFTVIYTPTDEKNYNVVSDISVTVEVTGTSSIVINKDLNKTYDKTAVSLTENDVKVTGSTGAVSFTWYSIESDNTEKKLESAPTDAGDYKVVAEVAASGHYEGAKAEQKFTISKATPDYQAPTDLKAVAGQKLQDVELPDGFTWTAPDQNVGEPGANVFTVIYTPSDTKNYEVVNDISVTVEVTGKTSVTINKDLNKSYDGNAVSLTEDNVEVTGSTGAISFTWYSIGADSTEKELEGAPANAGDYKVVVKVEASGYYEGASEEQSFTISKATPEYEIPEDLTATEGQTLKDVTLPDGFTWEDDSHNVGEPGLNEFTVKFTPKDTANYEEVTGITVTVEVTGESSITINKQLDKTYNGTQVSLTEEDLEVTGSAGEITFTWYSVDEDTTETLLGDAPANAGNYKVVVKVAASGYYKGASAEQTFTISKATPAYSIPEGLTAIEGQTLKEITLPKGFEWENDAQSVGTAGRNTFKATYTPDDTVNYKVVTDISIVVEVSEKAPEASTIRINKELDKVFDTKAVTLTKSDVEVTGSTGEVSFTWYSIGSGGTETKLTSAPVNAGSYKVVAEVAADDSYAAASTEQTFTISKATPEYEIPKDLTATEGQMLKDVTLPEGFAWEEPSMSVGTPGRNTFKATYTPDDTANYNMVTDISIVIEVSELELGESLIRIVKDLDKTYNGEAVTLTREDVEVIGSTGEVIFTWYSTASGSADQELTSAPTDAGTYKVVAKVAGDDSYAGASTEQNFTIFKAVPEYETPTGLKAIVGQTLRDVTLPKGFTWEDDSQSVGGVGTHQFTATYTPDDTVNYEVVKDILVMITVEIQSSISISVEMLDKTYDGSPITFTEDDIVVTGSSGAITVEYYKQVSSATRAAGWELLSSVPVNAGHYKMVVTVASDGTYSAATLEREFTIAKAIPSYTVPTGLKATVGQTLADVKLPEGFTWENVSLSVGAAGSKSFMAMYTPADTTNYETVSGINIAVEVSAVASGIGQANMSAVPPRSGDDAFAGILVASLLLSGLVALLVGRKRINKKG